jgi:hypothetical protein
MFWVGDKGEPAGEVVGVSRGMGRLGASEGVWK